MGVHAIACNVSITTTNTIVTATFVCYYHLLKAILGLLHLNNIIIIIIVSFIICSQGCLDSSITRGQI